MHFGSSFPSQLREAVRPPPLQHTHCSLARAQVERLASGLRHEPAFVAAALDVSGSEASTFVSNMLKVDSVPSVLLYPEAARGCLKFLGGPDCCRVMATADAVTAR